MKIGDKVIVGSRIGVIIKVKGIMHLTKQDNFGIMVV
jgi:hypothetical protein